MRTSNKTVLSVALLSIALVAALADFAYCGGRGGGMGGGRGGMGGGMMGGGMGGGMMGGMGGGMDMMGGGMGGGMMGGGMMGGGMMGGQDMEAMMGGRGGRGTTTIQPTESRDRGRGNTQTTNRGRTTDTSTRDRTNRTTGGNLTGRVQGGMSFAFGGTDPAMIEEMLKRYDEDGDGRIEENEVDGRNRSIVEAILQSTGIAPDFPIHISSAAEQITRAASQSRGGRNGQSTEAPLVPGFGVAIELTPVTPFGQRGANDPGGATETTRRNNSSNDRWQMEGRSNWGDMDDDEMEAMMVRMGGRGRGGDTEELVARLRGAAQGETGEDGEYVVTSAAADLPDTLPEWFYSRDINLDGQVAMYEWTQNWTVASAQEFQQYDIYPDGFITASECLTFFGLPDPRTLASTSGQQTRGRGRTQGTSSQDSRMSSADMMEMMSSRGRAGDTSAMSTRGGRGGRGSMMGGMGGDMSDMMGGGMMGGGMMGGGMMGGRGGMMGGGTTPTTEGATGGATAEPEDPWAGFF